MKNIFLPALLVSLFAVAVQAQDLAVVATNTAKTGSQKNEKQLSSGWLLNKIEVKQVPDFQEVGPYFSATWDGSGDLNEQAPDLQISLETSTQTLIESDVGANVFHLDLTTNLHFSDLAEGFNILIWDSDDSEKQVIGTFAITADQLPENNSRVTLISGDLQIVLDISQQFFEF